VFHVGRVRRGTTWCAFCAFGGILKCTPLCKWGDLLSKSIWEDKLFYLRTVVRGELFGLRTTP
jgi:hypothetical protein